MTTIENVKSELSYCHLCGNVDVINPCNICADDKRKMENYVLSRILEIYGQSKKAKRSTELTTFWVVFCQQWTELDLINSTLSHY